MTDSEWSAATVLDRLMPTFQAAERHSTMIAASADPRLGRIGGGHPRRAGPVPPADGPPDALPGQPAAAGRRAPGSRRRPARRPARSSPKAERRHHQHRDL